MPTMTGIWYMVLLTVLSTVGFGVLLVGYWSIKKKEDADDNAKRKH